MNSVKKILICPMDWGLGHATRMVPVIELLKEKDVEIILGADNRPYEFLKHRFPDLPVIRFEGYVPHYPKKSAMALKMLSDMPEMMRRADEAHAFLEKFVKKNNIDIVISDNRYELWTKYARTVFVTHQIEIQTGNYGKITKMAIKQLVSGFIKKFDELWIPDFEGDINLSGKLSHVNKYPLKNRHFIGPLSRFGFVNPKNIDKKPDVLIMLSGPEPQRSILEVKLKDQAFHTGLNTVILQGRPEDEYYEKMGNVEVFSHLPDEEVAGYINNADIVISRPGYSTVMDLAWFGAKAVFIPTPGQTEQKYLAEYLKKKGYYYYQNQNDFDLEQAIAESVNYSGVLLKNDYIILKKRIENLINQ